MTLTTKAELLAALDDNYLQIQLAAASISGRNTDEERRQALERIVGLRKARRELEAKLRALAE